MAKDIKAQEEQVGANEVPPEQVQQGLKPRRPQQQQQGVDTSHQERELMRRNQWAGTGHRL